MIRLLGEGGAGQVWEAEHLASRSRRALKLLEPLAGDDLARFTREAQALASLDHPHVVRVHAAVFEGPQPHLAQELLGGGSLQDRLASGPLPEEQARALIDQVAAGVAHAHARGVLHRDLKPENVLLSEAGEAKVADFGLALWRHEEERLTQTGTLLGTPAFVAPEQVLDHRTVDERTDVYGVAAILYALLTGRPPHDTSGTLLAVLANLQTHDPTPIRELNPHVDRALAAVCQRALARDPDLRPPSVEALRAELRAARRSAGASWLLGLAATALVVALTLGALLLARSRAEPGAPPVAGATSAPPPRPAPSTASPPQASTTRFTPRRVQHPSSATVLRGALLDGGLLGVAGGEFAWWDLGAQGARPARVWPVPGFAAGRQRPYAIVLTPLGPDRALLAGSSYPTLLLHAAAGPAPARWEQARAQLLNLPPVKSACAAPGGFVLGFQDGSLQAFDEAGRPRGARVVLRSKAGRRYPLHAVVHHRGWVIASGNPTPGQLQLGASPFDGSLWALPLGPDGLEPKRQMRAFAPGAHALLVGRDASQLLVGTGLSSILRFVFEPGLTLRQEGSLPLNQIQVATSFLSLVRTADRRAVIGFGQGHRPGAQVAVAWSFGAEPDAITPLERKPWNVVHDPRTGALFIGHGQGAGRLARIGDYAR